MPGSIPKRMRFWKILMFNDPAFRGEYYEMEMNDMKRMISVLAILVLCVNLFVPVLADEFVPSITEKDGPVIVPVKDKDGNDAIAEVLDVDGNVIDYLYENCLVITPLAKAKTSPLIPDEAEALLLEVYDKLSNDTMNIPYEKFNAGLDPEKMVIRDLYDVSWLCGEDSGYVDHPDHPTEVSPKGITIRLTFDLGVGKNAKVYTSSFKNNEWNPIVSTVNNGDGTVTCVFEDFCPVAFSVESSYQQPPAQTGDNTKLGLWITVMTVSAVALAALLVVPAVSKKRQAQ